MFYFKALVTKNKDIKKELLQCYGIGELSVKKTYSQLGLNKQFSKKSYIYLNEKWKDLQSKEDNLEYLDKYIYKYLSKKELTHLDRCVSSNNYKGLRHLQNLPLRGQRTHTNRKTQRAMSAIRQKKLWTHVNNTRRKN